MKTCDLIHINYSDFVEESKERMGKDQSYMLDSNKLRKEQNWQDNINLEEGILFTVQWIDNNIDLLKNLPHNYIHKT